MLVRAALLLFSSLSQENLSKLWRFFSLVFYKVASKFGSGVRFDRAKELVQGEKWQHIPVTWLGRTLCFLTLSWMEQGCFVEHPHSPTHWSETTNLREGKKQLHHSEEGIQLMGLHYGADLGAVWSLPGPNPDFAMSLNIHLCMPCSMAWLPEPFPSICTSCMLCGILNLYSWRLGSAEWKLYCK